MSSVSEIALDINGTFYSIKVGHDAVLTLYGAQQGFGECDKTFAKIEGIEDNDNPEDAEIILKKEGSSHQSWEDGYWLTLWVGDFVKMFSRQPTSFQIVNRDYMYKKKNLKGERCRIIAVLSFRDVFVEMENNIGGGSCDGTGRKGHCIPIKKEFLTSSSKKSKKAKGEQ